MFDLGLRLTLRGGREAAARVVFIVVGVTVGVTLLFCALAGFNGLHQVDARWAWLDTRPTTCAPASTRPKPTRCGGTRWPTALRVRSCCASTSPPPVRPRRCLPASRMCQGRFSTTPRQLMRLLSSTPAAELGERFRGLIARYRQQGLTIPTPSSPWWPIPRVRSARCHRRSLYAASDGATCPKDIVFIRVVLGVGAVGLLIPVLVLSRSDAPRARPS